MNKKIKIFIILIFTFCVFFNNPTKVKAYTHPTMSTEQAQAIIDYYIETKNWVEINGYSSTETDVINLLNNFNAADVATNFNSKFLAYETDFSFDDVFTLCSVGSNGVSIVYYVVRKDYEHRTFSYLELYKPDSSIFQLRKYNSGSCAYLSTFVRRDDLQKFYIFYNYSTYQAGTTFGGNNYKNDDFIFNNNNVSNVKGILTINDYIYPYINETECFLETDIIYFDDNGGIVIPSQPDINSGDNEEENNSGDIGEGNNQGNNSPSGTYYNYDFNEYFMKPYINIETINGLTQYTTDSATIPFSIYSQSGDEYFPFNSLKIDLIVFQINRNSGDNGLYSTITNSYKRYNGNFADTTGYINSSVNGNIIKYDFDLKTKFGEDFLNQYMNDYDGVDYGFELILYDYWGDVLSRSKSFYFYDSNKLNSTLVPNNYYDDLINNTTGYNNIDLSNTDFSFNGLIDTFKNFMSVILGFLTFLPSWLIALITLGITSAIAIRILGR